MDEQYRTGQGDLLELGTRVVKTNQINPFVRIVEQSCSGKHNLWYWSQLSLWLYRINLFKFYLGILCPELI